MALVKDWVIEAAREIATRLQKRYDYLGRGLIAETVIRTHSPFKEGIAYIPVPRCETCKHWTPRNQPEYTWSDCEVLSTGSVVSTEGDDVIQTQEDFGCVQWEKK